MSDTENEYATPEAPPSLSLRRVLLLAIAFIAVCTVAVAIVGQREAWRAISLASPVHLLAAVAVISAGWMTWAMLYRTLLGGVESPQPLRELYFLVLASLAADRVIPSAGAAGVALRIHQWRRRGIRLHSIVTALLFSEVCLYTGLLLLLWGGLTYVHSHFPTPKKLIVSALVASSVVTLILALLLLGLAGHPLGNRVLRWLLLRGSRAIQKMSGKDFAAERHVTSLLADIAVSVRQLLSHPRNIALAVVFANLWWTANLIALHLVFLALGRQVDLGLLIVAYVMSALASAFTGVIAGLGATEAAMVGVLTLFGCPLKVSLLAVPAFRLIEFWMPIPLGVWCYRILQRAD